MTQTKTVNVQNLLIAPLYKIRYNGEWSYEFQIHNGEGVAIEVDDQQYDTFRIFSNGVIRGTLSESYYVYDEVNVNDSTIANVNHWIRTDRLYNFIHDVCHDLFEDHTEYALAEFAEDEDDE